jgi:aldose 1-epimerase
MASFGRLADGTDIGLFTLANARGVEVRAITYGAILVSVRVPDRRGQAADVVLGFDDLDGYLTRSRYFGAVVGRYGNRIAHGRFTLDGRTFQLATNNGPNHLHGGVKGFDKVVWRALAETDERRGRVALAYTTAAGEEAYPGTVNARVSYTLTDRSELVVDYEATADAATPINLTQHSYFNLAGEGTGDILGHVLALDADQFLPVDETMIPTGELAPVGGTPFDFRRPTPIGARINAAHEQLQRGSGYDHNFVLQGAPGLRRAAHVVEPGSGRTLEISTTEPGVQFYSGNHLTGQLGKAGHAYQARSGFCLETQHFPDSPNHPHFPSAILRPGETYRSKTVFTFGVLP